jgi:uncharacterized protein (TIGR00269 family)
MDKNITKFNKNIENKVKTTISKYKLFNKKQKLLVALSGGKDSATIFYILSKLGYNVQGFHINLGLGKYSERCLKSVKELCFQQDAKLHIYDMKKEFGMRMCNIRVGIQNKKNMSNCMICGIFKKWLLNREARKLKVLKIITGHNLDDEAQTIIINFLQGNLSLGINSGPITGIKQDKKFIPRIKPLYFVAEKDIKRYSKNLKLPVIYEKCPCALDSLRINTRKLLKNKNTKTKENIINNFLSLLPDLKKKFVKNKEIKYCEICGEPSRNKICKKCKLLNIINKN